MITKLIIDCFLSPITWLLSALPTFTLPAYVTGTGPGTLVGTIRSVYTTIGSLDAWLPLGPMLAALSLVFGAIAVALTVRTVRVVASFLTGGGGSAA